MSITSLRQVTALVEEEKRKAEQTVIKLTNQALCYVRNMALNPIISAEEKAIRQKELAEEKLLVTFLGDALEKAEEGLRIVNEQVAKMQTEVNEYAAIQEKILARLRTDNIDVSYYLDCSLDEPKTLGSLAQELADATTVGLEVTASIADGELDVTGVTPVIKRPDINIPIPEVVDDVKDTAARVGGLRGSIQATQDREELIGEELKDKGIDI